ncbi:MAG: hypothetical protein WC096_06090, partial [Sphaerochaetaceae bacterium]
CALVFPFLPNIFLSKNHNSKVRCWCLTPAARIRAAGVKKKNKKFKDTGFRGYPKQYFHVLQPEKDSAKAIF